MITPASKRVWFIWGGFTLAAAVLFTIWPDLDVGTSRLAYGADESFASTITGLTGLIRQFGPDSLLALFGGLLLWAAVGCWVGLPKLLDRAQAIYVTLCLLLGPGLAVNAILKSYWGRARPSQTDLFGGEALFTPALQMTDQCVSNCSFVSGDASLGFCLTVFAFLHAKWRMAGWIVGLSMGAVFGATRIAQGAHFLSDIVFAGLIVIGINMALAQYLGSREQSGGA